MAYWKLTLHIETFPYFEYFGSFCTVSLFANKKINFYFDLKFNFYIKVGSYTRSYFFIYRIVAFLVGSSSRSCCFFYRIMIFLVGSCSRSCYFIYRILVFLVGSCSRSCCFFYKFRVSFYGILFIIISIISYLDINKLGFSYNLSTTFSAS